MKEYHKIQTVFKRDPDTKFKTLLAGEWAMPEFGVLAMCEWEFTEKVDGTNIRVVWDGDRFRFRGKTDRSEVPVQLATALDDLFLAKDGRFRDLFTGSVCLYGEGYGPKIQKGGGLYGDKPRFVLFDVRIGEVWLERHNVHDIGQRLGLDTVPVVGRGTLHEMVDLVRGGMQSAWGDFLAEGVVARPAAGLQTRQGHRIITKLKTKDFMS